MYVMDHLVAYIFEPVSVLKQYFDKHVFHNYNSILWFNDDICNFTVCVVIVHYCVIKHS